MHIPEWELVKDAAQVQDADVYIVDPEVGAVGDEGSSETVLQLRS